MPLARPFIRRDGGGVGDVQRAELIAGDRLNRVRNGLDRLGATFRGYDDLLEAGRGGGFPGRWLSSAVGGCCMRAQRGRDCRGNFLVSFQRFSPIVVCRFENRESEALPGRTGSTAAPDCFHGAPPRPHNRSRCRGFDGPPAGRRFNTHTIMKTAYRLLQFCDRRRAVSLPFKSSPAHPPDHRRLAATRGR